MPSFGKRVDFPAMRLLTLSFGAGHPAVITKVSAFTWDELASWLTKTPPEVNDKADAGWYIPAEFNPVYRDSDNFITRHAITFDFDHVTIDTWGHLIQKWHDLTFAMYTTYSHRPDAPRFRAVMPLHRPATYDEFQAVARKMAEEIGIELVARESFAPAQMMYSPARPLGGAFAKYVNEGDWLDVDYVLDEYEDWTDVSSWPRRSSGDEGTGARFDAREKPGIIGEFNRAFTISQAIERFDLPYRRVA